MSNAQGGPAVAGRVSTTISISISALALVVSGLGAVYSYSLGAAQTELQTLQLQLEFLRSTDLCINYRNQILDFHRAGLSGQEIVDMLNSERSSRPNLDNFDDGTQKPGPGYDVFWKKACDPVGAVVRNMAPAE
jgi:hypothetical protein